MTRALYVTDPAQHAITTDTIDDLDDLEVICPVCGIYVHLGVAQCGQGAPTQSRASVLVVSLSANHGCRERAWHPQANCRLVG